MVQRALSTDSVSVVAAAPQTEQASTPQMYQTFS